MKTKNLAITAFIAISLSLTSCDWLPGKKHSNANSFSLTGKWSIENIIESGQPGKNSPAILLSSMPADDSLSFTTEFMQDSLVIFGSDTLHYHFDTASKIIAVNDNTERIILHIKAQTDSSMQLYSQEDSVLYTLKRK